MYKMHKKHVQIFYPHDFGLNQQKKQMKSMLVALQRLHFLIYGTKIQLHKTPQHVSLTFAIYCICNNASLV